MALSASPTSQCHSSSPTVTRCVLHTLRVNEQASLHTSALAQPFAWWSTSMHVRMPCTRM